MRFFSAEKEEYANAKITINSLYEFTDGFSDDSDRTRLCRRQPPGNHREREELHRDQRQLEDLRQQRNRELRQGDRREAREYNEKIRDKRKEIYRDRREIYGDNDGRRGRDYGWWRRDRDRDHYYD